MGESPYYKYCERRERRNLCELKRHKCLAEEVGSALGWTSREEWRGRALRIGTWVVAKPWG